MDEQAAAVHDLSRGGGFTIGRGEDNDIRIDHSSVSRRHATLEVDLATSRLLVRDLGSANGTRVAGRQVVSGQPVEALPGEMIELGAVWLLVHDAAHRVDACSPVQTAGPRIVLDDPAMKRLFQLVERVAPSELSVLVLGETGVGKEVVAEAIHRMSSRSRGSLLKLNCGALPRALLEGELFGHDRGAFTGATEAKPGLFEAAGGGTVFLDEIGEIPLDIQVALLRVVEDKKVLRVGGREPRPVDVRFVAATNRDLRADVKAGLFRSDLYFRLNGVSIMVPPLRQRVCEIEGLTALFASRAAEAAGRRAPRLSPEALAVLEAYSWPGNLRELKNAVERAVVLCSDEGAIAPSHLPAEIHERSSRPTFPGIGAAAGSTSRASTPPGPAPLRGEVEELERRRILAALERCSGNQTRAAELLGMPRRTFVKRLDAYGIARPRKRS
ncbi:MAG: sigma 54-interacting transcriptional regulator [Deltaproteobacteria bacterium]|nr:sigma 54-interacting transcriptional regulator [Deltaproteobacteria bacterium]